MKKRLPVPRLLLEVMPHMRPPLVRNAISGVLQCSFPPITLLSSFRALESRSDGFRISPCVWVEGGPGNYIRLANCLALLAVYSQLGSVFLVRFSFGNHGLELRVLGT
eukprot:4747858-Amphidinium_carterae.1